MTFDVCVATYNSARWLRGCVAALAAVQYNKKQIALYFADNGSNDGTPALLDELMTQYEKEFAAFTLLPQGGNTGFGAASNAAARAGSGDFVFFLNPDTEIFPDAFQHLGDAICESADTVAGFELRQFPYEHPKYYNPASLQTGWCSGACFVLRRSVFEKLGGFDESIFMYAEDVELSWRIRSQGHTLRYVPGAVVNHYAYATPGEQKPAQVAGSLVGNLVLRLKYGTEEDIAWWKGYYERHQELLFQMPGVAQMVRQGLKRVRTHRRAYRSFYAEHVEGNVAFEPRFMGLDYEFARSGAFYENRLPKEQPRFSVLVRTYRRPESLDRTLQSLRWQTYKNFEVVVVEDGSEPQSAETVAKYEGLLDIRYIAANKQVGRCAAGNLAIEAAGCEYLCFLDDDDYFYAEHLEVMACLVEDNPACRMFVAGALEAAVEPLNSRGTRWHTVKRKNICHKRVTFATLCYENPFPIQAVVFHKSLTQQAGVLDTALDAFEDWDLWIRYGLHTPVAACEKCTSLFKIPASEEKFAQREEQLSQYRNLLYERAAGYRTEISAQDIMALKYTPELGKEWEEKGYKGVDYLAYKDKLAHTATEIAGSTIWKCSAPLRFFPRLLARVLGLLRRGFGGLAAASAELADRVGPVKPDIEKKDPAELNEFIFKSRRSASWRFGSALAGLKGGRTAPPQEPDQAALPPDDVDEEE